MEPKESLAVGELGGHEEREEGVVRHEEDGALRSSAQVLGGALDAGLEVGQSLGLGSGLWGQAEALLSKRTHLGIPLFLDEIPVPDLLKPIGGHRGKIHGGK